MIKIGEGKELITMITMITMITIQNDIYYIIEGLKAYIKHLLWSGVEKFHKYSTISI